MSLGDFGKVKLTSVNFVYLRLNDFEQCHWLPLIHGTVYPFHDLLRYHLI